jgi:hypothetical protein
VGQSGKKPGLPSQRTVESHALLTRRYPER